MSVSRLAQMLDNLGAESDQLTASMNTMDQKNKELSQIATRNINQMDLVFYKKIF